MSFPSTTMTNVILFYFFRIHIFESRNYDGKIKDTRGAFDPTYFRPKSYFISKVENKNFKNKVKVVWNFFIFFNLMGIFKWFYFMYFLYKSFDFNFFF
jgi:hypothetical protein